MPDPEITGLYNTARSRHMKRREQALRSAFHHHAGVTLSGRQTPAAQSPEYRYLRQRLRSWFDAWEKHLWDTYCHERDRKDV